MVNSQYRYELTIPVNKIRSRNNLLIKDKKLNQYKILFILD